MRGTEFLPVSREEMLQRDWYYYDFLVVTADAQLRHHAHCTDSGGGGLSGGHSGPAGLARR